MAEDRATVPDSFAERELDFEDIEGQEKLSIQQNRSESCLDGVQGVELRVKITEHSNILGARVYGVVHKVCWGSYGGNSACLLVVRFRFASTFDIFRLRKAFVAMRFDNYPPRKGGYSLVGGPNDPVLCMYSPRQIFGIPTNVDHEIVWSIALQCSVSIGPASIGPEASRASTTRYATQAALEIAGMEYTDRDKDHPNVVTFEIDENPKIPRGVPKELYFGAVVQCDGPVQADIETSVGDRWAWPWTRDDPIILKPGFNYGEVPTAIPRTFERLTDDDWKVLVPYQEERTNAVQWRAS